MTTNSQQRKMGRRATPADKGVVKRSREILVKKSPDLATGNSPRRFVLTESKSVPESIVSTGSGGLPVSRNSAQIENALDNEATALPGRGDNISCKTSITYIKGKSVNILGDSTSEPPSHSLDKKTLHKLTSRPPRYPRGSTGAIGRGTKAFSGQHHAGKLKTGISQTASFADSVGAAYRSGVDIKAPAADHPGFVGDGAEVQACIICGERAHETESLICDSCEEVSHTACVRPRMNIPKGDDWLCRKCKKKKKIGSGQRDSDLGWQLKNVERKTSRIGSEYNVTIPVWTGAAVDPDDTLAEPSTRFGYEVPLTAEEKQREQEQAEHNLANNKWPKDWPPAKELPPGVEENWLQCTSVLVFKGKIRGDGREANKDIICGKWRRAPVNEGAGDDWICEYALPWDPHHADCHVPQELSTQDIMRRRK